MYLPGFRVYQFGQPRLVSAIPNYLPCPVSVDAEYQLPAITSNRAAAANIFLKQAQGATIQRQNPLPVMLLLFAGGNPIKPLSTPGTEGVVPTQPFVTTGAGELQAALQVLDSDSTPSKIYIFDLNS